MCQMDVRLPNEIEFRCSAKSSSWLNTRRASCINFIIIIIIIERMHQFIYRTWNKTNCFFKQMDSSIILFWRTLGTLSFSSSLSFVKDVHHFSIKDSSASACLKQIFNGGFLARAWPCMSETLKPERNR